VTSCPQCRPPPWLKESSPTLVPRPTRVWWLATVVVDGEARQWRWPHIPANRVVYIRTSRTNGARKKARNTRHGWRGAWWFWVRLPRCPRAAASSLMILAISASCLPLLLGAVRRGGRFLTPLRAARRSTHSTQAPHAVGTRQYTRRSTRRTRRRSRSCTLPPHRPLHRCALCGQAHTV
jgi:hypothetical protein